MVSFGNNVVVRRGVRRREPKPDIPLELITYKMVSVSVDMDRKR